MESVGDGFCKFDLEFGQPDADKRLCVQKFGPLPGVFVARREIWTEDLQLIELEQISCCYAGGEALDRRVGMEKRKSIKAPNKCGRSEKDQSQTNGNHTA
jgi:hypothetical protein